MFTLSLLILLLCIGLLVDAHMARVHAKKARQEIAALHAALFPPAPVTPPPPYSGPPPPPLPNRRGQ